MELVTEKKRVRLSKGARKRQDRPELVLTDAVVRVAEPADEDGIMHLARVNHNENGLFALNEERARRFLRPALHKLDGIIGVIGERNKLEAVIVLKVSDYWYSDERFLEELSIFVHPDYRRAKISRVQKLVAFAKQVADGVGMPLIVGVLSNDRTSAKVALYQKQFGAPAGAFFLYGRETGHFKKDADTQH
jgi:GNAT superfamily N-acetyltransferase